MIVADAPDMSVAITSYNRRELLLEGLAALDRQTLRLEVIVADDGSDDGSAAAVAARWPAVTLIRNDSGTSNGVARQLRLAYERASCRHLASFDEDFHLDDPCALEILRGYFDNPRVAVVAIPFRDVLLDNLPQQVAPTAALWERYTFTGNGYLIDLECYRTVGGYLDWYQSYRQEEDLALRLIARGWIVRIVPAVVEGRHHRRPGGVSGTGRFRSARNDLLFYWRYAPARALPGFLLLTAARNLQDGWRERDIVTRLRGLLAAPGYAWRHAVGRAPLSPDAFRRYRRIKRAGILPVDSAATP